MVTTFFALSRNGKELEKNLKIRPCDLDLWPMTLKFSGFWAVVKVHLPAKCHPAKCSGAWIMMVTEKKLRRKQHFWSLPQAVKMISRRNQNKNAQKPSCVVVCGVIIPDMVIVQERLERYGDALDFEDTAGICSQTNLQAAREPSQWSRLPGQQCRIPNCPSLSLTGGRKGCFVLRFSHSGKLVTYAVSRSCPF